MLTHASCVVYGGRGSCMQSAAKPCWRKPDAFACMCLVYSSDGINVSAKTRAPQQRLSHIDNSSSQETVPCCIWMRRDWVCSAYQRPCQLSVPQRVNCHACAMNQSWAKQADIARLLRCSAHVCSTRTTARCSAGVCATYTTISLTLTRCGTH